MVCLRLLFTIRCTVLYGKSWTDSQRDFPNFCFSQKCPLRSFLLGTSCKFQVVLHMRLTRVNFLQDPWSSLKTTEWFTSILHLLEINKDSFHSCSSWDERLWVAVMSWLLLNGGSNISPAEIWGSLLCPTGPDASFNYAIYADVIMNWNVHNISPWEALTCSPWWLSN